nr:ribosomal protein S7 [Ostreobium quekettii]UXE30697.1 ribosomal protein S7 [Ostreobium quekettii]UXE30773.1 ribosomal protein S7 [Ostreobium quekettii]UXE30849.1 ribosomal protein S7 [Ostreobium quekettii]
MSRNKKIKKQLVMPDPFFDSILIQKITNKLMKKGKKTLAHKIINQTIKEIEKKTQKDPVQIIEQAIANVAPAIEIKARRIGGAVYSIPIELDSERGISVAIRWILNSCNNQSGKPYEIRLSNELIDASKKIGSAIRKREETHKIAESNARLM